MTFHITGLPLALFQPFFALDDEGLARHDARRVVADKTPGFPCRVSLADAAVGETLILLHHEHQPASSPYRASHAIYVREAAEEYCPGPGEVPACFRTRMLSVRAFDREGMMRTAELVNGTEVETVLERLLADSLTDYLHLHYAAPGCFAARVDRD